MNTNLRRALLVTAVLAVALVSSGCSDPLYYAVDNQTDAELRTWGFHESCDQLISFRNDYEPEHVVPPRQRYEYSESSGRSATVCIQIVDEERRLIFAEPYDSLESGPTVYTVTSLEPIGPALPDQGMLPSQSWLGGLRESISEDPEEIVFLVVAALVSLPLLALYVVALVLVPKAVFLGVRAIYRDISRALRSPG